MNDLHKYLVNPFDDPRISLAELVSFASDHYQRIVAAGATGPLAARQTATNAALTAVNTAFADDQAKLGTRKGRKVAKENYRKSLPAGVAKVHAAAVAKFGTKGPEVSVCFPQGRSIFGTCPDDQLAGHLQAMITGVTAYQAQLGATLVTDATALLTGWNAVYTGSESASGAKTTSQAAQRAAREGLQLELFKNLMTLGLAYPRQPQVLDLHMQQSLLADHPAAPDAAPGTGGTTSTPPPEGVTPPVAL